MESLPQSQPSEGITSAPTSALGSRTLASAAYAIVGGGGTGAGRGEGVRGHRPRPSSRQSRPRSDPLCRSRRPDQGRWSPAVSAQAAGGASHWRRCHRAGARSGQVGPRVPRAALHLLCDSAGSPVSASSPCRPLHPDLRSDGLSVPPRGHLCSGSHSSTALPGLLRGRREL